ncbi:MAG: NAD(P)-dependent oxidoreductase [Bryobacteraceae bacterium]|nr:NAD(P)-dependent oxidoreductase [Bryobacteraceae bacterium]
MKRVLLTGATGYIGRALTAHLMRVGCHAGYLHLASEEPLADTQATPFRLDTDSSIAEALAAFQPDVVMHLAAVMAPGNTRAMLEANVVFGTLLCEAMVQTGCRALVNTGTFWQYGPSGEYAPNTLYASTKQAFQDVVTWFAIHQGLRAVTLALFDVFGPHDSRPKLITDLVRSVRAGEPVDASTGEQPVCPIYIDDVCSAFEHAGRLVASPDAASGHVVFAADTGIRVSVRAMVEHFMQAVAKPVEVRWGAKPQRTGQIRVPVAGMPVLPGWSPRFDLPAAMQALVRAELLAPEERP